MLVDAHCHLYGFTDKELKEFKGLVIASVGEDLESSMQNISLSKRYGWVKPFVGIHPWNIEDYSEEEFKAVETMIREGEVAGIGEVGLDKRLGKKWEKQVELFERFCSLAAELNLPLNIHALDAWREAFHILQKYSIKRALFHWYTGPQDLLKDIEGAGYYISINPSVKIQPKHRAILEKADLEVILTESDGPYNYKGLRLNPLMINDLVKEIASVKDVSYDEVSRIVSRNFERLLYNP